MEEIENGETISQEIVLFVKNQGIKFVFLVPGGLCEGLNWGFAADCQMSTIVTASELGAGYMADGYARSSGLFGVCIVSGGPGAAYVMPAASVARIDDVPVLYITGDIHNEFPEYPLIPDTSISGTRDMEMFDIQANLSLKVEKAEMLASILERSKARIHDGKTVHLSVPHNVQFSKCIIDTKEDATKSFATQGCHNVGFEIKDAQRILNYLECSKKPILLLGRRANLAVSGDTLQRFIEYFEIPTATTLRSKGILAENHSLSLGNFGYAGRQEALDYLFDESCDLIIIIGADLFLRDSMYFDKKFAPANRRLIQIDTKDVRQPWAGLNNYHFYKANNLGVFYSLMLKMAKQGYSNLSKFSEFVNKRTSKPILNQLSNGKVSLSWAISTLRSQLPVTTKLFVDSGTHRAFSAFCWEVTKPNTFYTSDQMVPMGWAIAAAIGGHLASPDSPTLVITGDGCMRMTGMEISTSVRYKIPIIYLVVNNGVYQSPFKRSPNQEIANKIGRLSNINWARFAKSLGADASVVRKPDQLIDAISKAKSTKGPFLIDLRTDLNEPMPQGMTIPKGFWPERSNHL